MQVSTEGAKMSDLRSGWNQAFDERELKTIELCATYGRDPFGAPNHNFMLIIAKMQILLERYWAAYIEGSSGFNG